MQVRVDFFEKKDKKITNMFVIFLSLQMDRCRCFFKNGIPVFGRNDTQENLS